MSFSSRNSIYRTWVAFGVFLFLITLWFVWGLSSDQTEQRIRGEQSTQRHIEYAKDRIDQECLTLEGVALRDCIHQQIEAARDHSRSEQDLDAQQDMAFFTKIMGGTAVVGLVLGIGSVALIFLTLSETQRLARDTREIGEAQARAYPSATSVYVGGITNNLPNIIVDVKNSGNSPALNLKCHGRLVLTYQGDPSPSGTVEQLGLQVEFGQHTQVSVPPNSDGKVSLHVDRLVGDDWEKISSNELRRYPFWSVQVFFEWSDVFNVRYNFYINADQRPSGRPIVGKESAFSELVLKNNFNISYQSSSKKQVQA